MMDRRRGLMKQPRLPVEYQEVEWISNVNYGYIVINNVPSAEEDYEFCVEIRADGTQEYVFGNNGGSGWSLNIQDFSKGWGKTFNWRSVAKAMCFEYSDGFHVFKMSQNSFEIDSEIYTHTINAPYVINHSLKLMILGSYSAQTSVSTGCKVKYFIRKLNGTVLNNMVACYRKSDGVAGMYDLANNYFFTNASLVSGSSLVAGPDVN